MAASPDGRLRIVLSHVFSWPEVRRGGERYLHELASGLADAGHHVQILSTAPSPARGEVLGVPITYLRRRYLAPKRFGPLAGEVAFGMAAGAWMAGRRADVWHALGTADAASAALLGRVRRIRSVHTYLGVPERWYRDGRPDRRLHDIVVRQADDYVCLSRTAGQALRDGWGRDPVVLGGGVDLRRFSPLGERHRRPAILYSGNFSEPRKNLALLLEAVALLRKRRSDVELWLSGSGDLEPVLSGAPAAAREAVVELGEGREDEQADRYRRAWVTALPSQHEAFGLCLLESLACGTPIVVLSAGGGPAEILGDDAEVGVGSEATAGALADACERALDLATQPATSEACRAKAERYDWRRSIVPRMVEIYEGAAGSDFAAP